MTGEDDVFPYSQGGYIPGGMTLAMIHPEECIITRDLKCVRAGHQHEEEDVR